MQNFTVVYHQKCEASLEFVAKSRKFLERYNIEYIDIYSEEFETEIIIDVVPILVQGSDVYKGKEAFDKLDNMDNISDNSNLTGKKSSKNLYTGLFVAPPDTGNEKKVTFDKKLI
jgi:hypothetical protein